VRIPSGEYKLTATVDSGPLWGILKAASTASVNLETLKKEPSMELVSDCMVNLKQLGFALQMYAQDHKNKFPDDLKEIYQSYSYSKNPAVFWCPADTDPKPTDITNSTPNQPNSCQISYTYYSGHSANESNPAGTILVEDNDAAHHGGRKCCLFADGHVELR